MVYATDLKSVGREAVRVRFPPPAPVLLSPPKKTEHELTEETEKEGNSDENP